MKQAHPRPYEALPKRLATKPPPAGVRTWERVFVALLFAQGVYNGCRLFAHSLGADPGGGFGSQSLAAAGTAFAALICCGGHERGALLGLLIGLVNAGLLLPLAGLIDGRPGPIEVTAWFASQGISGVLGAASAVRIWKPFPGILPPDGLDDTPVLNTSLPPPPLRPVRALIGALIVVSGGLMAERIGTRVTRIGPDTMLLAQFFRFEAAVLISLLGGAYAGAASGCGLKQGLACGSAAALVLLAVVAAVGIERQLTTYDFILVQFGATRNTVGSLGLAAVAAGLGFSCGLAGGWLGNQLLPPVVRAEPPPRLA